MRCEILIVAISCWFLGVPGLVSGQELAGRSIAAPSQADGDQADGAQADGDQADGAQADGAQADGAQADEAQADEAQADGYRTEVGVLYREGDNLTDYMKQNCRLDIYYPSKARDFSTVVWFHGGGLTGGKRSIPKELLAQGVAVVAVDYRLYPKVKSPDYIRDAAAAVAWTFKNIAKFGGSDKKIFVSGHSAGGYLTYMVGMDKRWLAAFQIDADRIAGLIPYSGHTITHFTVRAERGINSKVPIVDELAPLYHVRKEAPPMLVITGDRELEMLGRYEENAYFWRMMKVVGHQQIEIYELDGYNHGKMAKPAHPLLLKFVRQVSNQIK